MPKHDYTAKIARLTKILTLLHSPASQSGLCAKELAEEFQVSLRTLRRDVEAMGAGFVYHKDRIYFEGKRAREQDMAFLLLKSFAYSMNGAIKAQMLSLLESLESSAGAGMETQGSGAFFTRSNLEEITLGTESIALLQRAIREHKIVGFCFVGDPSRVRRAGAKPPKEREVLPLKILNFSGEWYLLGLESGEIKKFYLNSVRDLREIGQGEGVDSEILGRLDMALNAWFVPDSNPFLVRLWVDAKVAKYFKRRKISPNQHLEVQKDGSLDISLSITSFMEIAPLVLMWIPNIVVLEPQSLREFIKNNVESYMQRITE